MNLQLILCAVVSNVVLGLTKWINNVTADGKIEAYELKYLVPTVVTGALAGLTASIPMPQAVQLAVVGAGGVAIQNLLKAAALHGPAWLSDLLDRCMLAGLKEDPKP